MKTKLMMIGALAAACVVQELAAMPTEEESRRVEPIVKKMLASERAALNSGKMTRSEVAAAAMKLADEADTDAAKLLLMKGAFALYVKDGNLEKAVETMKTLEAAISDMPPQSVTNMIEAALAGVSKRESATRLYKILDEAKAGISSHVESKLMALSVDERSSVASILKGMIKIPGHDYWLSATELTQGQWEAVMGYNQSTQKGANLPVDNVSHDDCDVFLKMLNKTKEVLASRLEFCIPSKEEWDFAASAGGLGWWCVKPGVSGEILDMAWYNENSSNQFHAVATKAANALGFYDMAGNVWEWTTHRDDRGVQTRGGSAGTHSSIGHGVYWQRNMSRQPEHVGLRLAAHVRSASSSRDNMKACDSESMAELRQATVSGYTWLYRMVDSEAMIVATNDHCSVSPRPTGDVRIPSTLDGVKVTSIGNHAFCGCRGLTSVTIPNGVTSIGNRVFKDCLELRAVTIPSSVRNIGEWTFERCYGLRSVTIPPSVQAVGFAAFYNCRGLTSVTIPEKVAVIGGAAFAYCDALKQINVDMGNQSFTSIDGVLYTKDQSVLLACPNALTSVKIPKSVTHIGYLAFEGCKGLTSVTIPEGIMSIEGGAFKNCGGLASVRMPSGLKKIGYDAFWGCGELTSLTLPQGLTKIGGNAFRYLGKLTSVTIPECVTSIDGGVFSYCDGLTQINVEAGNKKYVSVDGVLYTKDLTELIMCPNAIKEVTIPESVASIGYGAFLGCGKLTSLILPSSVKRIGELAFEACNGLSSVMIPDSVAKIDQYAFLMCGELTSLTIRGERPDAPNNIFWGCGKLKEIHVPANAKSWAGMKEWFGIPLVFDGQSETKNGGTPTPSRSLSLLGSRRLAREQREAERQATVDGYTWSYRVNNGEATIVAEKDGKYSCAVSPMPTGDIVIPETLGGVKVTRIGRDAFANCYGLTSVNIPQGVTSIDQGILWNCSGLKSVVLPSSLKTIGMAAFSGCSGLTSVTIPEGVTHIGYDAFSRCSSLTSVVIPSGVDVDARAFSWCHGLKSVTIAKGVTRISQSLFVDCTGLKSVTIPEGVTEIGVGAFMGCRKLGSVTIPASVTNIEIWAFSWCEALKQINVADGNKWFASVDGVLYTKDLTELVICPNDLASVMIPEGVGSIRPGAFRGCSKLTSVMIPASVESCSCAFEYCGALKQINVDVQNQKYASVDGVVYTKDLEELVMAPGGLKSVPIPAGVKRITSGAFKGCSTLTSVTIPAGVDRILPWTFEGCTGLESVTIQGNVTYIGHQAFWACRELTSFTMRGERPEAPNDIFMGCGKLKAIHVPANAKSWAGMKDWFGIPLVFDGESVNDHVDAPAQGKNAAAKKLQSCDFLLNKDFKRNAKYYLCLFSASWCGPCRREMPRIAKTYAETLKDDQDIELIHFSWDQDDEKALAWAKEHDVKFPVVRPKGGNPLDLHTRGIPHLFIVKADGTLVEEGHPMKLFTDEKLRELKAANDSMAKATEKTGDVATKLFPGSMGTGLEKSLVGYWPFDGNANDATKYRNNGTLHGVTPAEDRHGNANKAYRFNGSSYIEVPHSETLNMTHAITMTAWVKPQSWWANQWIVVMQKGDQRNVNYQFAMRISDNRVFLCNDGISQRCGQLGLELNKWQQVALTYESGKNFCFYRNGALIGKWQCSQDLQPNKGSLLIGYDPFGAPEYLIGDMDDVRLFNRALSDTEIQELYEAETPEVKLPYEVVDGAVVLGAQNRLTLFRRFLLRRRRPGVGDDQKYCAVKFSSGAIVIPDVIDGLPVRSIGHWAFSNCKGMTSVTIPASVTNIADMAFSGCNEITSFSVAPSNPSYSSRDGLLCSKDGTALIAGVNGEVTIPSCVKRIGKEAFKDHNGLMSVTIPESVTNIADMAFSSCNGLKSVRTPANVESIGKAVFSYCSALKEINVDSGNQTFTSIDGVLYTKDRSVLVACPNALTAVTIPKGVTGIGPYAFEGCNNMTSVTIPEGVTRIECAAFKECGGLASVAIPSSVERIEKEAFLNCRSLTSVTIPDGVTCVDEYAFRGCGRLTAITIPSSVKDIKRAAFYGCSSLTSLTIQEGVEVIDWDAFQGCTSLTSMTIPSSVTSIGTCAFCKCSQLKSATILSKMLDIGYGAFKECGELTAVTMRGECPTSQNDIFKGCGKLKAINVPATAKSWDGMQTWHGIPIVVDGAAEPRTAAVEIEDLDIAVVKERAENGDAAAMCELGSRYRRGVGVGIDDNESAKWTMMAASNGHERAIGICYALGYGVAKDAKEEAKWYKRAVDKGDRCAMNNLGLCYEKGAGVEKDEKEAAKWMRMAADMGLCIAMDNFSRYYYYGIGVDKDYKESLKWMQMVAEKGDAVGMLGLGEFYRKGEVVDKDEKESVKWYRRAAEKGHVMAMNNLGVCYEKGAGVEKDEKEAVKWVRMAADKGLGVAMRNLGRYYDNGIGVDKNYKESLKWLRMAAEKGDVSSMSALGYRYENGNGVEKDEKEAEKWYRMAADKGDARAIEHFKGVQRPPQRNNSRLWSLSSRRRARLEEEEKRRHEAEQQREAEERKRDAEWQAREAEEKRQREAERAEARRQLEAIREELRKAREARQRAE